MTEIKLDGNKEVGWYTLPGELRALARGDYDGKDMPLGLPTALRYLADAIEEQVKPAIEEPTEAWTVVEASLTIGTSRRQYCLNKAAVHSQWPWVNSDGHWYGWGAFAEVEVLRVGIGEAPDDDAKSVVFKNGWDHGHKQGAEDFKAKAITQLRALRAVAITAERKDAYDQAANAVAELS